MNWLCVKIDDQNFLRIPQKIFSQALSFAATLGLMLYSEPLQEAAFRGLARVMKLGTAGRLVKLFNDSLLVTLAAQITTLPLIAYLFGRVSPVSLLTNLLILPAQPPLMILGGLATAAGLLWLPLGRMLGWASYLFLWWTIRVVEITACFPYASVDARLTLPGLVAIYGLILGATWWMFKLGGLGALWRRLTGRLALKISLASAAVSLALAISFIGGLPDGRLHVTFLDVGEGEAILIQTPTGRRILVDGGPDPAVLLARLGRELPFWDRSLDIVIATHPDSAHINGLPAVLESYRVGALITNGQPDGPAAWEELLALAEEMAIPLVTAVRGQTIEMGDGVMLEVLHPGGRLAERDNDNSIVLRLTYGETSFLLTGDAGAEVEMDLIEMDAPLQSIVLKAADGGDRDATSQTFLEAVNPWVVVFSVGESNPNRHPAGRVLERVEGMGCAIARTDELGSIHFVTDGRRLWVDTER